MHRPAGSKILKRHNHAAWENWCKRLRVRYYTTRAARKPAVAPTFLSALLKQ